MNAVFEVIKNSYLYYLFLFFIQRYMRPTHSHKVLGRVKRVRCYVTSLLKLSTIIFIT